MCIRDRSGAGAARVVEAIARRGARAENKRRLVGRASKRCGAATRKLNASAANSSTAKTRRGFIAATRSYAWARATTRQPQLGWSTRRLAPAVSNPRPFCFPQFRPSLGRHVARGVRRVRVHARAVQGHVVADFDGAVGARAHAIDVANAQRLRHILRLAHRIPPTAPACCGRCSGPSRTPRSRLLVH